MTKGVLSRLHFSRLLCELETALTAAGLKLNGSKTELWSPQGVQGIPRTLPGKRVASLVVLGASLKTHGDEEDTPAAVTGSGSALGAATERLKALWQRLTELQKAGLGKQAAGALLRTYAGSSSQHALRLERVKDEQAKNYDRQLPDCWADLLERPLTEGLLPRLGLPLKLGALAHSWQRRERTLHRGAPGRRHLRAWRKTSATTCYKTCSTNCRDSLQNLKLSGLG